MQVRTAYLRTDLSTSFLRCFFCGACWNRAYENVQTYKKALPQFWKTKKPSYVGQLSIFQLLTTKPLSSRNNTCKVFSSGRDDWATQDGREPTAYRNRWRFFQRFRRYKLVTKAKHHHEFSYVEEFWRFIGRPREWLTYPKGEVGNTIGLSD